MRLVRDSSEGQWLPSRFNLAMFRLLAFIAFHRTTRTMPKEPRVFSLERHQSTFENHSVLAWFVLTSSVYFVELLRGSMPLPVLAALAIPATAVVVHLLAVGIGLLVMALVPRRMIESGTVSSIVSSLMHLGHMTLSGTMLRHRGPARWTAIAALSFVALNALAAIVMLLLRSRIAKIEAGYVRGGRLFGE